MMRHPAAPRLTMPVSARDHSLGPATAPVTLVEYGDYECPLCRQAYPMVKQLLLLLGRQLRFVFRHFPLTMVHPHAQQAAEAVEAAGAQGKFWQMHDVLYSINTRLTTTIWCGTPLCSASISTDSTASSLRTSTPRTYVKIF
jgi:protein-disulfide isomerase